jgi:hypothetical protein
MFYTCINNDVIKAWFFTSHEYINNNRGGFPMEPINSEGPSDHFLRQLILNKFLLLTVFLAVSAAAYFALGLFMLLRN